MRPHADRRFRHVLGEAGVEQLLKTTIEVAVAMKAIKPAQPEAPGQEQAVRPPCVGARVHLQGQGRSPIRVRREGQPAVTHKSGLMVVARSFPGNRTTVRRSHTGSADRVDQHAARRRATKPTSAVVDLGYRGVDAEVAPVAVVHLGRYKSLCKLQRRWLKRRQAIEPLIGHSNHDHGMDRYWLNGIEGDGLHAVLCAAGFNIAIVPKGCFAAFVFIRWLAVMLSLPSTRDPRLCPVPTAGDGIGIWQGQLSNRASRTTDTSQKSMPVAMLVAEMHKVDRLI